MTLWERLEVALGAVLTLGMCGFVIAALALLDGRYLIGAGACIAGLWILLDRGDY